MNTLNPECIQLQTVGRVGVIRLNRPKKLNAIKEANGDNDWLKDLRGYTNPEFWKL